MARMCTLQRVSTQPSLCLAFRTCGRCHMDASRGNSRVCGLGHRATLVAHHASLAAIHHSHGNLCECKNAPAVDQQEVEALYWRFRSLDRGRKGFVTAQELLAIPELSVNPLAPRLVRMLDGCNYRDFVKFLAAFSARASPQAKATFMFECYDVDGDGAISHDDLRSMLQYMTTGQLSEEQVEQVLAKCLDEAGPEGVTVGHFLRSGGFEELVAEVPHRR